MQSQPHHTQGTEMKVSLTLISHTSRAHSPWAPSSWGQGQGHACNISFWKKSMEKNKAKQS